MSRRRVSQPGSAGSELDGSLEPDSPTAGPEDGRSSDRQRHEDEAGETALPYLLTGVFASIKSRLTGSREPPETGAHTFSGCDPILPSGITHDSATASGSGSKPAVRLACICRKAASRARV